MKPEGQVRILSGCAIAAVISKEGNRMPGNKIMEAMKPMHDRSNGLGGMGINSIEALRGNRLMLRGIGLTEKELEILGISHVGE